MNVATQSGKRFLTGTLTLDADERNAIEIAVPFKPSFASICYQGDFVHVGYKTYAAAYIPMAVNSLFPTGTIRICYDAATDSSPRYIYNYAAEIPYENGKIAFEPRSTSFMWMAGTYVYTLIE